VKKPQWITLTVGICLLSVLYFFGNTIPPKKAAPSVSTTAESTISIDSLIRKSKQSLTVDQLQRLNSLEHSIVRGDLKDQQIKVNHELTHFWKDSVNVPELYLWYQAEAARLENSEKTLTFAAHQFLDNLVEQSSPEIKQWEALQAKDLFERSLKLNPNSDSSKIGLGAVYLYGGIASPMQGIRMVREVADRDSSNVYAQTTLGIASLMSGQLDKAIERFKRIAALTPGDAQAIFRVATLYEQMGDKIEAKNWYSRLLPLMKGEPEAKNIENKIAELSK
jgi:tetratricopeptide (TPR) repeat protein